MSQSLPVTANRAAALTARERTAALPAIHPSFRRLPPPVIVVGMHRSGTSLAAGMLHHLGVYLGSGLGMLSNSDQDHDLMRSGYAESECFYLLHDAVLGAFGAAWNRPEPFIRASRQPHGRGKVVQTLQQATFQRLQRRYGRDMPQAGAWGWKDPRSSLTLPMWLEIFPDARVLFVRRDPEAAARSLQRRATHWRTHGVVGQPLPPLQRLAWWITHPAAAGRRAVRKLGYSLPEPTDPCADLDYCRTLTSTYIQCCEDGFSLARRRMEIVYEEVLADPAAAARRLAEFAEANSVNGMERAAALVRTQPLASSAP